MDFLTGLEGIRVFGNPLLVIKGVCELALRFSVDISVVYIIIRLIFYPRHRQKDYAVSYFLINIAVFLACTLLSSINKVEMGFAFGLFAIFSILRYRTEQIPMKEMTYLFICIIVAVLNSLSKKHISYAEILLCNVIVVGSVYLLEMRFLKNGLNVKLVRNEKIELLAPGRRLEMIADLRDRTGLDVVHFHVNEVDFLTDTARLKVFYQESAIPGSGESAKLVQT